MFTNDTAKSHLVLFQSVAFLVLQFSEPNYELSEKEFLGLDLTKKYQLHGGNISGCKRRGPLDCLGQEILSSTQLQDILIDASI